MDSCRPSVWVVTRSLDATADFQPCRGRPSWRLVEGGQEWREGVYADDALVTRINGSDDAVEAARRGRQLRVHPPHPARRPASWPPC